MGYILKHLCKHQPTVKLENTTITWLKTGHCIKQFDSNIHTSQTHSFKA